MSVLKTAHFPLLRCFSLLLKNTTAQNFYSCSYFADRLINLRENFNSTSLSYKHIHVYINHVSILVCLTYFTWKNKFIVL